MIVMGLTMVQSLVFALFVWRTRHWVDRKFNIDDALIWAAFAFGLSLCMLFGMGDNLYREVKWFTYGIIFFMFLKNVLMVKVIFQFIDRAGKPAKKP